MKILIIDQSDLKKCAAERQIKYVTLTDVQEILSNSQSGMYDVIAVIGVDHNGRQDIVNVVKDETHHFNVGELLEKSPHLRNLRNIIAFMFETLQKEKQ